MNTAIVLLLLIVVIYALMNQMTWLALGAGVLMILTSGSSGGSVNKQAHGAVKRNFMEDEDFKPLDGSQTLQILNWPGWGGKQWWEVFGVAHGEGLGKMMGMFK